MAWSNQESEPKYGLIIPHEKHVSFKWATKFRTLNIPGSYIIASNSGASIAAARNSAVKEALDKGCKYLFFLDSDIIPDPSIIQQLEENGLDVVSGLYFTRDDDSGPAAWAYKDSDGGLVRLTNAPSDDAILQVDAVGLGCCLVHRRVFSDMEEPYFKWTRGLEEHPWDLSETHDKIGVSEDFYWCHKVLTETEYNIYLDMKARAMHEMNVVLDSDGDASHMRDSHVYD